MLARTPSLFTFHFTWHNNPEDSFRFVSFNLCRRGLLVYSRQTTETFGVRSHAGCRNHPHFRNRRLNAAAEIALVFRASPAPFSSRASHLLLVPFTPPPFFCQCLYRNPFSLLVRVIRGFKTAFHHPTLEKSGTEEGDATDRERRGTTRMTKVTKAPGKVLVPGTADRIARRESSGEF